MNVTRVQLAQVPYLDATQIGGRVVHLMPLYDGESWHMWRPIDDGSMIKLTPRDLGVGNYVAKAAAKSTDLHSSFIETVWQHLSYPEITKATTAISDDMRNLATALAKIDFFWSGRDALGLGAAEFVRTEIEYVLVVSRSLLDHLHEVLVGVWNNVRLLDEADQRRKKSRALPKKLSGVCFDKNENVKSADALTQAFALPPTIAEFYARTAVHLQHLRRLRDAVVHHGSSPGPIYLTERGFGVARDGRLAKFVDDWTDVHKFNENIVSLRPILAHLAVRSLLACDEAATSITSCIAVGPPMAPGYRVFTRVEHGEALLRSEAVLHGADPWWT